MLAVAITLAIISGAIDFSIAFSSVSETPKSSKKDLNPFGLWILTHLQDLSLLLANVCKVPGGMSIDSPAF